MDILHNKIKNLKKMIKFYNEHIKLIKKYENNDEKPPIVYKPIFDDDEQKKKKDDEKKDSSSASKKVKKPTKMSNDLKVLKNQLDKLKIRVKNYQTKIQLEDDTKTVALGTSKINYMDPRITSAWCKSVYLPIDKVFTKNLLDKFPWAMDTINI